MCSLDCRAHPRIALRNPDPSVNPVDVAPPQGEQLADPRSGEGGGQIERTPDPAEDVGEHSAEESLDLWRA